jgi:hypothetical protein
MGIPNVDFFTRETISQLPWPPTEDGSYAQRYLVPFLQNGPQVYIHNVHHTELEIVKVGETLLPVSASQFHPANTYTCSPYNHYISYGGYEEIQRLNNPPLETLVRGLLHPLAWYFRRSGFDRVAYVNNWLLSTNLYPVLNEAAITALVRALPSRFPDRAIVFRSVDRYRNPGLYQTLLARGCRMVLSRQVWYMDPREALKTSQIREDRRVLRRSPYEVVAGKDLSSAEIERCLELYNQLYLDKYSHYNPQFTLAFVRLALEKELLFVRALRQAGQIQAVMGYFVRNGCMTQPFFGYDTALPLQAGLYRRLTLITLEEGLQRGLLVHASAGVGPFKKLRGGKPTIEYNAVFDRHLPPTRRMPWALIEQISKIAIPIFRRYDL